jgi:hypothetical protein
MKRYSRIVHGLWQNLEVFQNFIRFQKLNGIKHNFGVQKHA